VRILQALIFIDCPPSLILDANEEMTVMQDENFWSLCSRSDLRQYRRGNHYVRSHPSPLALYYFGNDFAEETPCSRRNNIRWVSPSMTAFLMVLSIAFRFGGIGLSGMGAYHGKTGFLTFSHARSVYRQSRSPQAEHFCGLLWIANPRISTGCDYNGVMRLTRKPVTAPVAKARCTSQLASHLRYHAGRNPNLRRTTRAKDRVSARYRTIDQVTPVSRTH